MLCFVRINSVLFNLLCVLSCFKTRAVILVSEVFILFYNKLERMWEVGGNGTWRGREGGGESGGVMWNLRQTSERATASHALSKTPDRHLAKAD